MPGSTDHSRIQTGNALAPIHSSRLHTRSADRALGKVIDPADRLVQRALRLLDQPPVLSAGIDRGLVKLADQGDRRQ